MIQSESHLRQAIQQMENLCQAVNSLRAELFGKNPRNFAVMAEGPLEQIHQLQAQVDEYVRHLEEVPV
jgi:hypothetical protein